MSAYKVQTPGNYPGESIQHALLFLQRFQFFLPWRWLQLHTLFSPEITALIRTRIRYVTRQHCFGQALQKLDLLYFQYLCFKLPKLFFLSRGSI